MNRPLVSVIIPTYNSGRTLEKCLRSIMRQTYRNVEVIIVDRYSSDNTIKIAKKYRTKIYQVKYERAKAKNTGLKMARGRYVLFIDSDMELTPTVIDECVNLIGEDEKIGGIVIPERSVGAKFWVQVRDFERRMYSGTYIESARFFVRDLAIRVGGFDEDIVFYEENTLPQKISKFGYKVNARIKAHIIHHEENFELKRFFFKKYYYSKSAWKFKKRYNSPQTSLSYRLRIFLQNKKYLSMQPLLTLGLIILKTLEFLAFILAYFNRNTT